MKTFKEIKENRQKLIKRYHQAIDESCYQDVRELVAMIEILKWVIEDSEDENTNTL